MNKTHFNVLNLQNTQMKTQLKNALNKIDGVSMVNIDLGRGTVEVGYDESIDEKVIIECIEKVGSSIE
ncbi:MAG: heavy metal transport/detoxification protein [Clostridiales bacterium]|jgi:copper chaperone CopZ|nr:heavy metal transport/detoxification protein [Clostridiales bacterium]